MEQEMEKRNQPPHPSPMHGLSSRAVGMGIVLFVLIVVGMSMFVYLKKVEIDAAVPQNEAVN